MGSTVRSTALRCLYAAAGIALGGLGLGWHGRPSDAAIVHAIRGRTAALLRTTIALQSVHRDWLHEIFGTSASEFYVTATVTPPVGPGDQQCFKVEPSLAGTALAYGPYQMWRCRPPY